MERKNYLLEELSQNERAYLKRIVMTAKNKYIEKNYDYINNTNILIEECIIEKEDSVLDVVWQKCQEEVESALEFEKTLSLPSLYNVVKALSLKEKEVLFYLYKKGNSINDVAKIMNLDRKTVRKIRNIAQDKIAKKIIKGEDKHV